MANRATLADKIDTVASSVERGFSSVADDIAGIKHKLGQLPTREHLRSIVEHIVDDRVLPIHHQLRDINARLDTIEEQFKNLKGVTKEIDDIRDRVRAIERHLGLNKKIAA